jgi:hypothetical protein
VKCPSELTELGFCRWHASAKLLEEQHELFWADVAGSEELQGAFLNTHDELSFRGCSLAHDLEAGQKGVDGLAKAAAECQHFRGAC